MSTGGTTKPSRRGFDPLRAAYWMRRAMLPMAVLLGVLLWRNFGTLRVPAGMDTMPSIPPGSLCVIQKQPGDLRPGQIVFADVGDGLVLTRIQSIENDGRVFLQHDEPASRLPDSRRVGPVADTAVRALVLSSFASGAKAPVGGGGGGR